MESNVSEKKTRDYEKTRKEILDSAFALIYQNGFQGVSVDDIIKNTRLTKGAFYHHFSTKLELGYALVDEVISPMIIDRWIAPLDSYENPLEGILGQIKNLIGKSEKSALKLGCPLNNLVQEMSSVDGEFKRRLQIALNLWIEETDRHLKRAKKAGYLKSNINTRQSAYFIVMAHEGFYGMLKSLDPEDVFPALFNSLKMYFQTIRAD